MAEASCRRELELEIPAEEVSKKMESVAKEFARLATIPGFRKGKAPVSLIRRRFAEDIKGEVLQTLVPEHVEKALAEQKLSPVTQPKVDKLDFNEGQPVKFRAVFEVMPEFELGSYKGLELEMPTMDGWAFRAEMAGIEGAGGNAGAGRGVCAGRGPCHSGWRLRPSEARGHPGGRRRSAAGR